MLTIEKNFPNGKIFLSSNRFASFLNHIINVQPHLRNYLLFIPLARIQSSCSLDKKGENLQGSKLISVQPTAIARRKIHSGGRHMQQSGRPTKRAGAYDHNYANETGKKRIKSAPHSISICVENNISLAK
jgi:hypothetical protein